MSTTPSLAISDEERAGARAAASAGADAFDAGRWGEAITYFEKAEAVVHAPTHLLFVARANEKIGKLVAAREAYLKIVRETLPNGSPQAFRDAQSAAKSELTVLEPRVPRVSVAVQGAGELPVSVTMNGQPVSSALVGVPRPLDPGKYEFQAYAEGAQSAPTSLLLREGAKETLVLTLQASTATPPGSFTAAPTTAKAQLSTNTDQGTVQPSSSTSALRIGSYVALGVGVVGLGAGTVFAFQAKSKRDDANALCDQSGQYNCSEAVKADVKALDSDADKAKTLATVGFITGGIGIAAGVTLFVLSLDSKTEKAKSSATITPWIGWQSAGVIGSF
jgi:hypothetical protein